MSRLGFEHSTNFESYFFRFFSFDSYFDRKRNDWVYHKIVLIGLQYIPDGFVVIYDEY